MAKYWVWVPDRGETRDDAKLVDNAHGLGEAAEYYCKHLAGFNGDPFNDLQVRVALQGQEIVRDVQVWVEAEPVFSSSVLADPAQPGGKGE